MKNDTPKGDGGTVLKLADAPRKTAEIIQFPANKIVRMPVEPNASEKLAKDNRRMVDNMVDELTRDVIEELHMGYDVKVSDPEFQKDFSYSMECVRATVYRAFDLEHPFHDYMDNNVKVATKEEIAAMRAANVPAEIEEAK